MVLEGVRGWARQRGAALVSAAGLVVVLGSRWLTWPRTLWESDEFLFVQAIQRFDPLRHHPHPPGYPLLVGLGKTVNFVLGDPFVSLVALAVVSSLVGYLALTSAFEKYFTSISGGAAEISRGKARELAVVGSLLFFLSPAMLVDSTLPMSDPPALAFLALVLWAASGAGGSMSLWRAAAAGAFCSAAIGCRPQLALVVLPMLAVILVQMPGWRRRTIAAAAFVLVSLAWLVPLASAVGGAQRLLAWEMAQAGYVTSHDAALSRGGRSWAEVVLRFVAHPWGTKWLALPVLGAAALGGVWLARHKAARVLPLVALGAVQLGVCVALMDPADGVRYALPALPAVAFLAAAGLDLVAQRLRVGFVPALALVVFAAGSAAYVFPLVRARTTSASPPVQAAHFAAASLPAGAVILFEPSLRPHAELLLKSFTTVPVNEWWDDPRVRSAGRLWLFADGRTAAAGSRVFEWPECDAYGKLTRNHYRVVSLVPVSRYDLYRPARGLYPLERDTTGSEWRWAGPEAELQLVNYGCGKVRLTLGLDKGAPFTSTTVEVLLDSRPAGGLEIPRGAVRALEIPLAGGEAVEVAVRTNRSYVPAELGINRDPRRLAVQVIAVEQLCR